MENSLTNLKFKLVLFLLFGLPGIRAFSQKTEFKVIDKYTLSPVVAASVKAGLFISVTSLKGTFSLVGLHPGDTVKLSSYGYKSYKLSYHPVHRDTILIYMEPNIDLLKEVSISGKRNYQLDSLKVRKDYASVFGYHASNWQDAFISRSPDLYRPDNYITSHNNTTEILSVNVLALLNLINKNKVPVSRLHRTLIKDEQNSYVDHLFSAETITRVTALKGDSLKSFMDTYRPKVAQAQKMNDYSMVVYIKKNYDDFVKNHQLEKSPFSR
jgi:hypothetical protein